MERSLGWLVGGGGVLQDLLFQGGCVGVGRKPGDSEHSHKSIQDFVGFLKALLVMLGFGDEVGEVCGEAKTLDVEVEYGFVFEGAELDHEGKFAVSVLQDVGGAGDLIVSQFH